MNIECTLNLVFSQWLFVSCCSLAMAISTSTAALHPGHLSLTEVEWNTKSNSLEFSVCVWPEDVSSAIEKQKKVTIEKADQSADELFLAYLKKRLFVATNKKSAPVLPIRWVGVEHGDKKTWVYFQVNLEGALDGGLRLENRLFFDLHDEQVNHVKFKHGNQITWHSTSLEKESVNFGPQKEHATRQPETRKPPSPPDD